MSKPLKLSITLSLVLCILFCTIVFIASTARASPEQSLWKRYEEQLRTLMTNNLCSQSSNCNAKLSNTMWQMVTDPLDARWANNLNALNGDLARFVPKWSNAFEYMGYSTDATVEERYKAMILDYSDRTAGAKAFTKLQTSARDSDGNLPWREIGKTTLSNFVNSVSGRNRAGLFTMNNASPKPNDSGFIRHWYTNSGTVITRDMAFFDKYDIHFEAKGIAPIEISPGDWMDRAFVQQVRGELGSKYFGSQGKLPLLPSIVWVAYQPRITATVTRTMYYALQEQMQKNMLGVSVGGFFFSAGNNNVMGLDDEMDQLFSEDDDNESEIRFLGEETQDDDEILSDNSHPPQEVSFLSRSVATDQGVGAVAWFMGDVDGDGKDDLIHLWNCGNLCIMYYTAASGFKAHNIRTNQGPGAMAFFVGDVDGDKRADIIQIWNNRGRIGIIYYTAATGFRAHGGNPQQGSGHVRLMAGDVDGDGRTDIVHLWNNKNRLQIMYYTAASGFNNAVNVPTDQGPGAITYFIGDVDGDRRADVVQLWNNNGRLSFILYTAASGFRARGIGTNQGPGAVRFFLADVDGDKKKDIVQVWNNNGRANILYYTASSNFQARNVATAQGVGAVTWLQGDIYGDGREEIIQGWNCGNLCLMFYTPALNFDAHSYRTNQGPGAVAWLTGDVDGDGRKDIVQLWNRGNRLQIMWHTAQVNQKTYKIEFASNSPHPQIVAVSSSVMPHVTQNPLVSQFTVVRQPVSINQVRDLVKLNAE